MYLHHYTMHVKYLLDMNEKLEQQVTQKKGSSTYTCTNYRRIVVFFL